MDELENPLVSVLINNYNYAAYVGDAIRSALQQTYQPLEIIVVDDGSRDESRNIIDSFGDRIIKLWKNNGGQASAFNAGLAACAGDVICFLDADDTWYPEKVETCVCAIREVGLGKVAYLRHRLQPVTADLKTLVKVPIPAFHLPAIHSAVSTRLSLVRRLNAPSSAIVATKWALAQLQPLPESDFTISADALLYTLLPLYGFTVDVPATLGSYRIHGKNNFASDPNLSKRLITEFSLLDLMGRQALVPSALLSLAHRAARAGQPAYLERLGPIWSRLEWIIEDATLPVVKRLWGCVKELGRTVQDRLVKDRSAQSGQ